MLAVHTYVIPVSASSSSDVKHSSSKFSDLIWRVLKNVQMLKLHSGNKQDHCLLQTLHKQDWRKGLCWVAAEAEVAARGVLLFYDRGASLHKPEFFSGVVAEKRQLAVQKTNIPQQAPWWSWNSSISPQNSWPCWSLAAFSMINWQFFIWIFCFSSCSDPDRNQ